MIGVGQKFPQFSLDATVSRDPGKEFATVGNDTYKGKWKVLFFWPLDFTFVCPTEITAFGDMNAAFAARGAQVLGCSTDSKFTHLAWRNQHPGLKELAFPMLSDLKHELCNALGILDPKVGAAQRATFIVDPDDNVRFAMVTDLSVGRNPGEVLRVLDALQTGALTPCNWQKGEKTL
jgi:peroxiredoxin (alkyl hydroperoxide reductase subunit C)